MKNLSEDAYHVYELRLDLYHTTGAWLNTLWNKIQALSDDRNTLELEKVEAWTAGIVYILYRTKSQEDYEAVKREIKRLLPLTYSHKYERP